MLKIAAAVGLLAPGNAGNAADPPLTSAAVMPPPPPSLSVPRQTLPKGVRLKGKTGFGTLLSAPPSPIGDITPQRQNYRTVSEWYAQENGLPLEEARKRLSEQQGFQPIFERLQERLRRLEPDNYISARINHKPDWHYELYFKRDPDATLRRYSVNPRFKAAKAAYTEAELKALAPPWLERFAKARIADVYGADPTAGRVSITIPDHARPV